jgi:two-component system chemotaxis response regulator CheY
MATYDFGLLTILIVEDNAYMRRMQRMLLQALGVGNVIEKSDGGEAIEFLRKVKENPMEAGVSSVDPIAGDGGDIGQALVASLQQAIKKCS